MQFKSLGLYTEAAILQAFAEWGVEHNLPRKGRCVYVSFPDGKTSLRITKTSSKPDAIYQVEQNI